MECWLKMFRAVFMEMQNVYFIPQMTSIVSLRSNTKLKLFYDCEKASSERSPKFQAKSYTLFAFKILVHTRELKRCSEFMIIR